MKRRTGAGVLVTHSEAAARTADRIYVLTAAGLGGARVSGVSASWPVFHAAVAAERGATSRAASCCRCSASPSASRSASPCISSTRAPRTSSTSRCARSPGEADVMVRGSALGISGRALSAHRAARRRARGEPRGGSRCAARRPPRNDQGARPRSVPRARRAAASARGSARFDPRSPQEATRSLLSQRAADSLGARARRHACGCRRAPAVVALRVVGRARRRARRRSGSRSWTSPRRSGGSARLGELHRIDLKLAPGTEPRALQGDARRRMLPPGVLAITPDAEAERSASLSRAYRTNLDMLALVALFTGAFLVFSTQFLALLRRRTQLALLRVVGHHARAPAAPARCRRRARRASPGPALGVALGCVLAQVRHRAPRRRSRRGLFQIGDARARTCRIAALLVLFRPRRRLRRARRRAACVRSVAAPARARAESRRRRSGAAAAARDRGRASRSIARCSRSRRRRPSASCRSSATSPIALMLVGAILVDAARSPKSVLARMPQLRYAPAALAAAQLQATPRQVGDEPRRDRRELQPHGVDADHDRLVPGFARRRGSISMLPADLYVRAGRVGETGLFHARGTGAHRGAAGRARSRVRAQPERAAARRPARGDAARAAVRGRAAASAAAARRSRHRAGSRARRRRRGCPKWRRISSASHAATRIDAADRRRDAHVHGRGHLARLCAAERRDRDRPRALRAAHGRRARERGRAATSRRGATFDERRAARMRTALRRRRRRRDRVDARVEGDIALDLRPHLRRHLCARSRGRR